MSVSLESLGAKRKDQLFNIPVEYNSLVARWIKHFQTRGRNHFQTWLNRSASYGPTMKKVLKSKKLPSDLIYLSMIESGYVAQAKSSAQAVGFWQFIKPTALRFGLKINWWIDERSDLLKSTHAAADYLNWLYKRYGDWELAMAAYNMGEGRLDGLIKRHKSRNYWVLGQKSNFPKESQQYVPKVYAATILAKAPELYGFKVPKKTLPPFFYHRAKGGDDLHQVARKMKVSRSIIKKLNPELKMGFIPKTESVYTIKIPLLGTKNTLTTPKY